MLLLFLPKSFAEPGHKIVFFVKLPTVKWKTWILFTINRHVISNTGILPVIQALLLKNVHTPVWVLKVINFKIYFSYMLMRKNSRIKKRKKNHPFSPRMEKAEMTSSELDRSIYCVNSRINKTIAITAAKRIKPNTTAIMIFWTVENSVV